MELMTTDSKADTLPDGWTASTVGTEFDMQLGKMLDREKNTGVEKPYLGNRSVQWGRILTDNLDTMRMSPADVERYRLLPGDLLVCEGGEIGRAAIWTEPLAECYFQKALHRLRPRGAYEPALLLAYLEYWTDHGLLSGVVTQTSIAHLTKEKLGAVPLLVPPREEQKAITEALTAADSQVEALDTLIEKKRAVKQAVMQRLLTGRHRLPGSGGEWETKRLGAIATSIASGKSKPSAVGRFPVYGSTGALGFDDVGAYTGDTVLVARVGSVGTLNRVTGRYGITDNTIAIKLTEAVSFDFVWEALNAANLQALAFGTSQPLLTGTQMKALSIEMPPLPEQRAIAEALGAMDAEIKALIARRDKARLVKRGMAQDLLTGRCRLVF